MAAAAWELCAYQLVRGLNFASPGQQPDPAQCLVEPLALRFIYCYIYINESTDCSLLVLLHPEVTITLLVALLVKFTEVLIMQIKKRERGSRVRKYISNICFQYFYD